MPDRAIIALLPAITLAFIGGILASALLLESGATLMVGIAGGVVTALASMSSVFGVRGEAGEKTAVAALRTVTSVGLYVCVYLFMLGFLREGNLPQALIWVPLAALFGLVLVRMRVRGDRDMDEGGEPA